jgi:hypothetical protein
MSRKRTPDQESTEISTPTETPAAVAEPSAAETKPEGESFADKGGQRKRIPTPDPFPIATDPIVGVKLFGDKRERQLVNKFDDQPSQAVIDLLKERTQLHEQLRKERELLPTMELYAKELKTSHEAWKEVLTQAKRHSDPSQIASEALELALKDLEERLPSASLDGSTPLSLDAAMLFLRHPTSRG